MWRILLSLFAAVAALALAGGSARAIDYIYGPLNLNGLTTNGALYYDGTKLTNNSTFVWDGTNVKITGSSGTDRGTVYQNDVGTQATAGIGSTGSTCGINNYFVKTNAGCSLVISAGGGVALSNLTASGVVPTNSGTCLINTQLGGNTAGSFKANGACAGGTIILAFATAAPSGWVCEAHDLTTTADALNQTAYSTTSCTITGTMASLDLVIFHAVAF